MLDVLRVSALVILPCTLFLFLLSQFLVIRNRNPEIKLFQLRLLYNPLIMQFRGRYYLTDRGIFWRNVSWLCFVAFMTGMYLATTYSD